MAVFQIKNGIRGGSEGPRWPKMGRQFRRASDVQAWTLQQFVKMLPSPVEWKNRKTKRLEVDAFLQWSWLVFWKCIALTWTLVWQGTLDWHSSRPYAMWAFQLDAIRQWPIKILQRVYIENLRACLHTALQRIGKLGKLRDLMPPWDAWDAYHHRWRNIFRFCALRHLRSLEKFEICFYLQILISTLYGKNVVPG